MLGKGNVAVTDNPPSSQNKLDLRIVFTVPLRQFAWWFIIVLLVAFTGYPGVVCITPMAWLLALRAGNQIAWHSKSGLRSQRLTESALAGGLLGLLQGILFAVIVPFMGPIRNNEMTNSIVLILLILVVGIPATAALSFFAAYWNENQRGNL